VASGVSCRWTAVDDPQGGNYVEITSMSAKGWNDNVETSRSLSAVSTDAIKGLWQEAANPHGADQTIVTGDTLLPQILWRKGNLRLEIFVRATHGGFMDLDSLGMVDAETKIALVLDGLR
jgi:hypothetical protein